MGCYNDDVLFIHIPKCAGWSVKKYLQDHLPGILMPDDPASKLPIGHVRLQDIERFTGRKPESFAKILAVVRDPYEQQLSQWSFWADRYARGQRHIHDAVAASYATLTEWLRDPRCDFHCWYHQHVGYRRGQTPAQQEATAVTDRPATAGVNRYEDFGGIYRYWLSVDGEVPANVEVIRLEEIETALPVAVFGAVDPKQEPPVQWLNSSPHRRATREYYTPEAARLVEAKVAWAFEHYYPKWLYSDG